MLAICSLNVCVKEKSNELCKQTKNGVKHFLATTYKMDSWFSDQA